MRVLEGEQFLVRVFLGESDRWKRRPLSIALLERLRKDGFAGATVFHGVAGFGAHSVLHTANILRLDDVARRLAACSTATSPAEATDV